MERISGKAWVILMGLVVAGLWLTWPEEVSHSLPRGIPQEGNPLFDQEEPLRTLVRLHLGEQVYHMDSTYFSQISSHALDDSVQIGDPFGQIVWEGTCSQLLATVQDTVTLRGW